MKKVTESTFEDVVLKSEKPVLVDFWAEWCGPCSMMAPVLEQLDQERDDIEIAKVNVDEEMGLAMQFRIASIPALLLFKDGQVAGRAIGYMSKEELCEALGI